MFRFDIGGRVTYPELQSFADKTLKRANAGDPDAQFLYGIMLAGLPQMNKSYADALPWFLKAAQNGQIAAQYQVGSSLLFGIGCKCEDEPRARYGCAGPPKPGNRDRRSPSVPTPCAANPAPPSHEDRPAVA